MKKFLMATMTACVLATQPSLTQATPVQALPVNRTFTAEDRAMVERVENYLSGITTIIADFVQIAPDGGLASGKFYLSRPGKMRWQYDPPTPILMVADGTSFIFYDYELDQTSYLPLQETLAGFLARDKVTFGGDVLVTDIQRGASSLRITMIQRDRPKDGALTLEFADNPLRLHNMKVSDAVGQETTVSLANARYGAPLDNTLFVFEDKTTAPRIGKSGKGIQR